MTEKIDHPSHYGGRDNPYEAIKVIEAWCLGFHLGNSVKYISRAGKKNESSEIEDLKKARWYLDRRIEQLAAENSEMLQETDYTPIEMVVEGPVITHLYKVTDSPGDIPSSSKRKEEDDWPF
jgi:hypothetical protein